MVLATVATGGAMGLAPVLCQKSIASLIRMAPASFQEIPGWDSEDRITSLGGPAGVGLGLSCPVEYVWSNRSVGPLNQESLPTVVHLQS